MATITLIFIYALRSPSWSVSQSSPVRVLIADSMCCRSLVFIYFRKGSSSFSFFSSVWYLSSLASFSTSGIYSCAFWKYFIVLLHFWPSGSKTIFVVSCRKTNRRKPRAICTFENRMQQKCLLHVTDAKFVVGLCGHVIEILYLTKYNMRFFSQFII